MAYTLKTENYGKPPSSGMRNLWREAWGNSLADIPDTRINFSLRVKEILAGPNGPARKEQLKQWRIRRERERASRRSANTEDISHA